MQQSMRPAVLLVLPNHQPPVANHVMLLCSVGEWHLKIVEAILAV